MKLYPGEYHDLRESVSLCHQATDVLVRAVDQFPSVGDAELHLMKLELTRIRNRLSNLRDNASEILLGLHRRTLRTPTR